MGLADLFSDLYSALTFTDVHAEEPAPEQQEEGEEDEKSEEGKEGGEDHEQEESQKGGDDEDGAEQEEESQEEEEEEEEEEPVDPKPRLEEECMNSAQCSTLKHHYDECGERVRQQEADPDYKGFREDCVEEFFHLSHCATQCAAPKLFRLLK